MEEIAVIGGGAAGMMAAISAAREVHSVKKKKKNEKLGKKIYITGKGRCNVTNACDFDDFLRAIVTNSRFMFSSLRGFFNRDLMEMIEEAGCPLKTERGERVFPVSDKASDITRALEKILRELNVKIKLNTEVKEITKRNTENIVPEAPKADDASGDSVFKDTDEGDFELRCTDKRGKPEIILSRKVIVCTGGFSYQTTGSTGDGYRFAESFGHELNAPTPALVPLELLENDAKAMQGLSLRNIEIRISPVRNDSKTVYSDFGEMLFTHFGASGPVILSASSYITRALREGERFVLHIDLKPALTKEKLDERILRDFSENINKNFENAISKLFPLKLLPVIIKRSGIDPHKKVNSISKREREKLISVTKDLSFTITGTRDFNEAIITQGGISVKDINPKTMESKKVKGLYFAGEVLDIDAVTGGYNLQLAFSTGFAAGRGC